MTILSLTLHCAMVHIFVTGRIFIEDKEKEEKEKEEKEKGNKPIKRDALWFEMEAAADKIYFEKQNILC